jgi:hypothetical protein
VDTNRFTFDHRAHVYMVGRRAVPSVTGKIAAAGLYEGSEWFTEESRIRGTRVHQATLAFDLTGTYDEPDYGGYVESYLRWRELMRPRWTLLEVPRYSKRYRVAGTADRLGIIMGVPVLVDFKTGPKQKWHPFQLAMYDLIYDELPPMVRRRFGVYLRADGRIAQHHEYRERSDYDHAVAIMAA